MPQRINRYHPPGNPRHHGHRNRVAYQAIPHPIEALKNVGVNFRLSKLMHDL